jgi:hypothetical protein
MSYITVGKENSSTIDIYYEDHGSGQPRTAGLSQRGKLINGLKFSRMPVCETCGAIQQDISIAHINLAIIERAFFRLKLLKTLDAFL